MSLILGGPGARVSRRSALRMGLAAAGLPGLISGNLAAYGQQMPFRPKHHYGGDTLCPYADLGYDPDTGTYYYAGWDCPPPPTVTFSIESNVPLNFIPFDCPGCLQTACDDYDCTDCPRIPPIPCKTLPIPCKTLPIPGKTLPIPGKTLPIPGTQRPASYRRKIVNRHLVPGHAHFVGEGHRDHFLYGLEYAKRLKFELQPIPNSPTTTPGFEMVGQATNYELSNLSGRYVGLLLYQPTQQLLRTRPTVRPVAIGVEVVSPDPKSTSNQKVRLQYHAGSSYAGYCHYDNHRYFVLMKGQ